jgi:hypothetical protein
MRLFGKKKRNNDVQENSYEIFGGFSITKREGGYEITWRSPNLTTITVFSEPIIDENVQTNHDGNMTKVLSMQCKLLIRTEKGETKAQISAF